MGDEALTLLSRWSGQGGIDLGDILADILATLVSFVEEVRGTLGVSLHHFKQSLVCIEHHLVLLDVNILRRD